MGNGYLIKCENCGFKFEWHLGVGMMYYDIKQLLRMVHYMRRPIIDRILENEKIVETTYEHRVYQCETCKKLRSKFWIMIQYGENNDVYETKFRCTTCDRELTNVSNMSIDFENNDALDVCCPKCLKHSLYGYGFYNWD